MTFQNTADLMADPLFTARLSACLTTEATGRSDALADQLLRFPPTWGASVFQPVVSASPGFGEMYAAGGQAAITDGDILSAVQANWARVAALQVTP